MNYKIPITDRFFDVFFNFKAIKDLRISLSNNTSLKGSIESLKHRKQLKYLYINYDELREDFFANIASFVPKLQTLAIITNEQFSDVFINSLKYFEKFYYNFYNNDNEIHQNYICNFGK